jgi:hypothetical protein
MEGPETGGAEFVRTLRRIHLEVKVIVTAATVTPNEIIESLKDHAFTKPFDVEALGQMIFQAIDTPEWTDGIEILSASPQWIELRVRCKLVTAERLIQFLREMKLDLAKRGTGRNRHSFREMLVNAMEHGGQFDPEQTVEVSYIRTDRSLMYCIADPGPGFLSTSCHIQPSPIRTMHLRSTWCIASSRECGRAASAFFSLRNSWTNRFTTRAGTWCS